MRVSSAPLGETLGDHHNLTLLLRLVVDRAGHLVHGELVDLDGASRGRFLNWDTLQQLLILRLED
jgi:hypothetical protein